MNIIFWDIDGTLIRTSRAGLFAFEEAVDQLWNKKVDFKLIETSGRTDYFIAEQLIEQVCGYKPAHEEIMKLTGRYEQLLAKYLEIRPGWVLPSIQNILTELKEQDDCLSLLLTGNSRTGAKIKLVHFGLAEYFDFEHSAFCNGRGERSAIAEQGLHNTQKINTGSEPLKIYVIGDTPHDIECGKGIGAYTIGVATGGYNKEQLLRCTPWWAVEELPAAQEFLGKLYMAAI